jgi:amino acid adenylation domain-containing protein
VAIVYQDRKITFNELNNRANQFAHLLGRKGIKTNDIVGLMTDRSIEMVLGLLSILKTGASYLPIVPEYPEKRIEYMLKDSDVDVILVNVDKSFADKYSLIHLNSLAADQGETSNPTPRSVPADLAYVIYTSGTTGNPKGVMISNQSVVNFIKGIIDEVVFAGNDAILSLTTITFDIFGLEVILPLTRGTRVVVGSSDEQLNPSAIAAAVTRENISIFQLTPSRLQIIISNDKAAESLKRLKYLLVGGEAFPDALLHKTQRLTGARIFNVYGPTETTIWSAIQELTERNEVNIGRPMANTRIYILNGQNKLLPLEVTGELCIAGIGVGKGYLNRVELTAERFVADPFYKGEIMYRTGDLARWLPNGELMFLGRIDHQVKVRGYRIEMAEIENHLQKYPGIKEAVVMAMEGNDGKYLCAYLVPSPSDSPSSSRRNQLADNAKSIDTAQLREYLAKELPPYMLPSYFVQLREFPLNSNGKVDRKRLPKPEASALSHAAYEAPKTETEEKLARVWQEVFEVEKIGINNDFFEMGGHSLKAIEIASRLEKYGFNTTIDDIFRFPTIKKIAEKIDLNLDLINNENQLINDPEEAEFSLKNQFGAECRLLKYSLPYKNYFVLFMEEDWEAEMNQVMDFIQSNWKEEIFPSYIKKLDKDVKAANKEIKVSEKEFNMLFNLKN